MIKHNCLYVKSMENGDIAFCIEPFELEEFDTFEAAFNSIYDELPVHICVDRFDFESLRNRIASSARRGRANTLYTNDSLPDFVNSEDSTLTVVFSDNFAGTVLVYKGHDQQIIGNSNFDSPIMKTDNDTYVVHPHVHKMAYRIIFE